MAPDRVRIITTATYEAAYTDQELTLSALEDVLHRLKDTASGDDTVCYSMIKNVPLATNHLFLRLINQSFSEGKLPTRWKMAKIIPIPKKDKTHCPISLLPVISKVMERLVVATVKWSSQPINPYSLGFRSGVGTIDAIATLLHTAAPITTLIHVLFSYNLPRPRKGFRTSFKGSITRISITTRHPWPNADLARWLPYEPNWNCTLSRKEVKSQPSDKWNTTRKQPESNIIQHRDQSTATTGP